MSPWVLPVTLYDLSILCSSFNVSRIVGNEIGFTTTPIECFHGHTNVFPKLTIVIRAVMDAWVLPVTV